MREFYQPGDAVLVFDVPSNRARAESGEPGIPARPAVVEADVTPHGMRWDPFATARDGAYVDAGPEGPAVYQVRFADGGAPDSAAVDVHRIGVAAEIAAAIEQRALASATAAQVASDEAARHQAEADRLRAAARAVDPGQ